MCTENHQTKPQRPLIIICELCPVRIKTNRNDAWRDAIDHAIDCHRERLLSAPKQARRLFRVTHPAGEPARLTLNRR